MKTSIPSTAILSLVLTLAAARLGEAFQCHSSPSSRIFSISRQRRSGDAAVTALHGYVPSGFTAEQYKQFKEKEAKKARDKKNLGGSGPRGFKSRSLRSFQEAMEKGEASHLMPMFNAKEKIKRGEIRKEDIPYMQRGGSWDNSDVKGARNKKKWLASDKQYSSGGYKKEQSVSILGTGQGLDWTGKRNKSTPATSNYQQANDKKKGWFGL